MRAVLIWAVLAAAVAVPLGAAAASPFLEWRGPIYVVAGFAGIVGLALMLFQPLLASGLLPGVPMARGRRVHRWVGAALVLAVLLHVAGLWVTSPPDVVDALTFTSPTPFSAWGVVAMWAVFGAALLAVLRRRMRAKLALWRAGHTALVAVAVGGTAVHALLIVGTMETVSKAVLTALVVAATLRAIIGLRAWSGVARSSRR